MDCLISKISSLNSFMLLREIACVYLNLRRQENEVKVEYSKKKFIGFSLCILLIITTQAHLYFTDGFFRVWMLCLTIVSIVSYVYIFIKIFTPFKKKYKNYFLLSSLYSALAFYKFSKKYKILLNSQYKIIEIFRGKKKIDFDTITAVKEYKNYQFVFMLSKNKRKASPLSLLDYDKQKFQEYLLEYYKIKIEKEDSLENIVCELFSL